MKRSLIHGNSGLTLAEVLIALVILAIGLAGVLAAFPVGQKMAAQTEQNTVATIIAANHAAIIRGFRPDGEYSGTSDDWDVPSLYAETDDDAPKAPVFASLGLLPFTLDIQPYDSDDSVLHDATSGLSNYEVSVAYASSQYGIYKLYLVKIHREGDEQIYNFLIGRGYDSWEFQ